MNLEKFLEIYDEEFEKAKRKPFWDSDGFIGLTMHTFESVANFELEEQFKKHYQGPPENMPKNILQYLGSQEVNAWQHAYISGLLKMVLKSKSFVKGLGNLKETVNRNQFYTFDAIKDLYNNSVGIDIAEKSKSINDFGKNLFEAQYNFEKGKLITLKSSKPRLIVNEYSDERIKRLDEYDYASVLNKLAIKNEKCLEENRKFLLRKAILELIKEYREKNNKNKKLDNLINYLKQDDFKENFSDIIVEDITKKREEQAEKIAKRIFENKISLLQDEDKSFKQITELYKKSNKTQNPQKLQREIVKACKRADDMLIERLKAKYGEDIKISIDYSNCPDIISEYI